MVVGGSSIKGCTGGCQPAGGLRVWRAAPCREWETGETGAESSRPNRGRNRKARVLSSCKLFGPLACTENNDSSSPNGCRHDGCAVWPHGAGPVRFDSRHGYSSPKVGWNNPYSGFRKCAIAADGSLPRGGFGRRLPRKIEYSGRESALWLARSKQIQTDVAMRRTGVGL